MTLGSMKTTTAAAALLACLVGTAIVKAQQTPERPMLSDQVFKNVQVMKGIPVDQFMATMGFFSASLGMSCEDCHMADDRDWSGFAADNARKRRARQMIQMMQKINADNFGGRQMVTCYSCHRGADSPRTVPDFAVQYGPLQPPDPNAIVASVRREVQAINPQLPLFAVGTLEGQISETLTTPRFRAVLLAGFAVIALLLATIGIYGVTAHAVGQRTHEVGIRMALGAARGDVLGLILVQHLKPALVGVTAGVVGAVILSQSLRTLVYGIRPTDPLTFIAMGVVLIAVTVVACLIPARRATRVDPLVALRAE